MSTANVAPGTASTLSVFSVGSGGSSSNYTWDNKSLTTGTTQIQSTLQVDGDADFDGDIRIQGSKYHRHFNTRSMNVSISWYQTKN
jgi:hypothetical protein